MIQKDRTLDNEAVSPLASNGYLLTLNEQENIQEGCEANDRNMSRMSPGGGCAASRSIVEIDTHLLGESPMNPRISLITLGVDDLEASLAFYRDGLGLETQGIVGTEFEYGAVVLATAR